MLNQTEMRTELGTGAAIALVVCSMIGTGIFTTTGFLAGDLGSPGVVLLSWVAGAAGALLGAICYAELSINLAHSGGEYIYLREAWGRLWGFLSGWVSLFAGFSAPIAVAALAFASYLAHVFPACAGRTRESLAASALVIALTVLNISGLRRSARFLNAFTVFTILVLTAFTALAFSWGNGSWHNFRLPAIRTSTNPLPQQFAVSLFYIYLSYSGWNAATYVAGEIKDPSRTLPRALLVGTATVTVLYLALNVVYIFAVPLELLKGQAAVGAIAAEALFGSRISPVFSALIAISLAACVNAQIMTGPRVLFAMALDGAFLSAAAKTHPRLGTPVIAIVAQGVCTLAMTVTPLGDLMQYVGFTLSLFTALGVASLFRLRRKCGWKTTAAVSFAWPLIPVLFLIPEIWMVVWGVQIRPWASLAGLVTIVGGALVFAAGKRLVVRPSSDALA